MAKSLEGPATAGPSSISGNIHVVTSVQERHFWQKVNETDSCWLWTGSVDKRGYGQVRLGPRPGRLVYSHRLSYEMLVGSIPDGLEIDHLCRVHLCCNPEHLEPVTHAENMRRGKGNGYREKTHCVRGHEFTPENTRRCGPNGRNCIACKVAYDAARYVARRAA